MNEQKIGPGGLRPRQAATFLSVSLRTLANWDKEKILVPLRVGHGKRQVLLYPVTALENFLAGKN